MTNTLSNAEHKLNDYQSNYNRIVSIRIYYSNKLSYWFIFTFKLRNIIE